MFLGGDARNDISKCWGIGKNRGNSDAVNTYYYKYLRVHSSLCVARVIYLCPWHLLPGWCSAVILAQLRLYLLHCPLKLDAFAHLEASKHHRAYIARILPSTIIVSACTIFQYFLLQQLFVFSYPLNEKLNRILSVFWFNKQWESYSVFTDHLVHGNDLSIYTMPPLASQMLELGSKCWSKNVLILSALK